MNIIGQKFNMLTVMSFHHKQGTNKYYLCKCDCGNETVVRGSRITNGETKSCGCLNGKSHIKDITEKRFGKLVVESFSHTNSNGAYWNCLCDCGNRVVVNGGNLRNGTKSCGCLLKETNNKRRIDITNQRFGKLVALYYNEKLQKWHCKCDCGNECDVPSGSLRQGLTQSCGCYHKELTHDILFKDLTGKKFNNLTVIGFDHFGKSGKSYWKCKCDCGNESIVSSDKLGLTQSCGCIDTAHSGSKSENEIKTYLEEKYNIKSIKSKNILGGKEIDLYYPEYNIGIEYNGSFYHASCGGIYKNLPKLYHRDKFLLAKERGIHLISIFDVDWDNNKDKIKSYLDYLFSDKIKVSARNCIIKKLDNSIANNFIDKYHLQSSNKNTCKINYGLFFNGELISVMSFGKLRLQKSKEGQYELHRYCVKDGYIVIGGANKLLKHFEKDYNPTYILSYSDNDYFVGNIYNKLGFKETKQSTPRYYWFIHNREIKREKCRLKYLKIQYKTLYEQAISEKAPNKEDYIMLKLGAKKVYRSGNTKWEKVYGG